MSDVRAADGVADLLRESAEWRRFFKACCETGALRLRAQAWQFRAELRERGECFELSEIEEALLTIARKVLPETNAAAWDPEWARDLCSDACVRLAERCADLTGEERDALDLSGRDIWKERMRIAGEANDPPAYRAALKGWERAALEALEAAKRRSGRCESRERNPMSLAQPHESGRGKGRHGR